MTTVTECKKIKDWTSKEGKSVPIYEVTLSDGIKGESFGKEIPLGTPADQIEITDGQYGKKFKLKAANSGGGGGFGGKQRAGNESFALSYSKDILVANWHCMKSDVPTMTTDQMFVLADKMFNWLESKKK